jgi:hypothetical protein
MQEDFYDEDSQDADRDFKPTASPCSWPRPGQPRKQQTLDEVLDNTLETLNELRPPKNSRKEISVAWEFIKGLRRDDISSIVQIIEHLPASELLKKAKEIEQLALRLDMNQRAEFKAGEKMSIIKR